MAFSWNLKKMQLLTIKKIFEFFKQVITTAGFTDIPSYEKVKKWVEKIIREKKLFSLMLQNEVEISFK